MSNKKTKFTLLFLLAVLGTTFFFGAGEARAECPDASFNGGAGAPDCLGVTQITRITHPKYQINNLWQGEGYGGDNAGSGPWNKDHTRIIIYEPITYNPYYGSDVGRGDVWGYVSVLKGFGQIVGVDSKYKGTLSDYESNTYEFPNYYSHPVWSLDNADTVYVLNTTTEKLVRYNIDTKLETDIASYDCTSPCSEKTITSSQIVGWTTDRTLIISFSAPNVWDLSGWEINLLTGKRTYISSRPDFCSEEGHRWPYAKFIHHGRSPDKKYRAMYNDGAYVLSNDYASGNCNETWRDTEGAAKLHNHCQWSHNNDWYVCSRMDRSETSPYITDTTHGNYALYQVFFNRTTHEFTHNLLLTQSTAGYWCSSVSCNTSKGGWDVNYHGLITPTVRNDSGQIMFLSTYGLYSLEDYSMTGATPYGSRGMFLADLAPASGAQTCTSFTYTAWSACQPNNAQTRTVTSSSPSGCTGGSPVLNQSCDTTPPAAPQGVTVE